MKTRIFLVLLLLSRIAFSQIPTAGLIGEYSFTGGSLTDGANGVNFTQTGTTLTKVNDRYDDANNAISINTDYLTRANISYPNSGADLDLSSVSFWIKTSTNSPDIKTILDDTRDRSNITDTTWSGYYIYLRDGKVGVSLRVLYSGFYSYRGTGSISPQVISDGNWHHVTITMKNNLYFTGASDIGSTSVALYVDGLLVDNDGQSVSSAGGISFSQGIDQNGNVTIGNNKTNNLPVINRYEDTIDDILFYGRRLTAAEITSIANNNYCFSLDSTDLIESNKTETSFDVSWTESGDFELAYALSGEPFSNATIIPVNGYTAGDLQNISGLTSSSFYNVYVRTKCTSTFWSSWSTAKEVRTGGVIYVNSSATGDNNGSSWINGFTDLQGALTVSDDNQEIWIAQGTYKPDASDKTVSFVISKGNMKIYGGFNGTETLLSDRDLTANYTTILSGDLNDDDTGVDFTGNNRSDNTNIIIADNAQNLLLDGLTISDGHSSTSGAGISKSVAVNMLSLKNCELKNNVALIAGAGIYAPVNETINGTINVENTIFSNNVARYGTSIYVVNSRWRTSTVNVSNSLFQNNIAKDNGSTKGYAGSAGWFRSTATANNSVSVINLTNNNYVNNTDLGTVTGLNNFNRATVGLTKVGTNSLTANVANCIFWGNTTVGGAVAKSIAEIHTTLGNISVYNSIGEDGFSNLTSLTSTSSADPLFTDASNNDFALQSGSPAIDTGDNSKIPASIITDILGNSRIFNSTVDMGVYEFGSTTPVDYTLTTSATNGTVVNNPSGTVFTALTSVILTATPNSGYEFSEWIGDETGTTNPLTISMNSNKNITAVFVKTQQTLTITAVNGSITTNPNPINGTYDYGTSVDITAVSNAGYQFDEWTEDATGNTITTTVIMDGNKSVTANFIEGPTFVNVSATGNNDGTTWADAYTDLQTAINNTAATKEIWVAKGTYKPTGNGRTATFSTNKRQKIYGGFQGTEGSLGDRDITLLNTTNATILSGDLNGDDNTNILPTETTRQDNAYHVLTIKGNIASGGELNGFVILGGNSNGSLSNSCSTASASQYD